MAELKGSKSDACYDYELEIYKGNDKRNRIIGANPSAIISTTNIHKDKPKYLEEGEQLFHS